MEKKILLIALIVTAVISVAYVNRENEPSQEYASLEIRHYRITGINSLMIVYEDGRQEDLEKTLNIKLKGHPWISQENFPDEVKAFKYLNNKGYVLISQACDSDDKTWFCSYIFLKKN